MHTLILLLSLATIFSTLAGAGPLHRAPESLHNFLLVTTSQPEPKSNSSELANVSATSLFDPFYQKPFYLRLISEGYLSLPKFNLTEGTLNTLSQGIAGHGLYVYNSTAVQTDAELTFLPSKQSNGNLGLKDGYLLSVDDDEEGWTICDGDLGEQVILWKGVDPSCAATYIQAVETAPY